MAVAMGTTEQVTEWLKQLGKEGCEIELDLEAGTAEALDNGQVVFKAIQKGYQQPWILHFKNSARILWQKE